MRERRKTYMPHAFSFTLSVFFLSAALGLSACSGETSGESEAEVSASNAAAPSVEMDGSVTISVERFVPEDSACLMMMQVENGTDAPINAGLFAFNVTGNDEVAGANMFPQSAAPGEQTLAQIVLPGSDCNDVKVIEGGQINCTNEATGESCIADVELENGLVDFMPEPDSSSE